MRHFTFLVPLGAYAAVIVFMAQTGLGCPARYLAPFYVLLLAPLLTGPVPARMTRSVFWRGARRWGVSIGGRFAGLVPPAPTVACGCGLARVWRGSFFVAIGETSLDSLFRLWRTRGCLCAGPGAFTC